MALLTRLRIRYRQLFLRQRGAHRTRPAGNDTVDADQREHAPARITDDAGARWQRHKAGLPSRNGSWRARGNRYVERIPRTRAARAIRRHHRGDGASQSVGVNRMVIGPARRIYWG